MKYSSRKLYKRNLLCIKAAIMTKTTFFLNKEHIRKTGRGPEHTLLALKLCELNGCAYVFSEGKYFSL